MAPRPWVDSEEFNPGYMQRSVHLMPKQGDHQPWLFTNDYYTEKDQLPVADLGDGTLVFEVSTAATSSDWILKSGA